MGYPGYKIAIKNIVWADELFSSGVGFRYRGYYISLHFHWQHGTTIALFDSDMNHVPVPGVKTVEDVIEIINQKERT